MTTTRWPTTSVSDCVAPVIHGGKLLKILVFFIGMDCCFGYMLVWLDVYSLCYTWLLTQIVRSFPATRLSDKTPFITEGIHSIKVWHTVSASCCRFLILFEVFLMFTCSVYERSSNCPHISNNYKTLLKNREELITIVNPLINLTDADTNVEVTHPLCRRKSCQHSALLWWYHTSYSVCKKRKNKAFLRDLQDAQTHIEGK